MPYDTAVVLMKAVPLTTPPLDFAHAVRTGPELVLRSPALKGEMVLELDTVAGLAVGDILHHLRELDPHRVEFAEVKELPPDPGGPGMLRCAIRLNRPLRFGHDAGVGVGVLGVPAGKTRLAAPPEQVDLNQRTVTVLTLNDLDALGAAPEDVLQIDEGAVTEYAQVLAISETSVTITPSLRQDPTLAGRWSGGACQAVGLLSSAGWPDGSD